MDYELKDLTQLAIKEKVSMNEVLEHVLEDIKDSRVSQFKFLVRMYWPWVEYIIDGEADQGFPFIPEINSIAVGQPWDVGDSGYTLPNVPDVISGAFTTWLTAMYDNNIQENGTSGLPAKYDLTRSGNILLFYAPMWLRAGAEKEQILELVDDRTVSTVIGRHMNLFRDGVYAVPDWDEVYNTYQEGGATSPAKADALAKYLFPDVSQVVRPSVQAMMKDAYVGSSDNSLFLDRTSNTLHMHIKDDADLRHFTKKIGMKTLPAPDRSDVPGWQIWSNIGKMLTEGNITNARREVQHLLQELISHEVE